VYNRQNEEPFVSVPRMALRALHSEALTFMLLREGSEQLLTALHDELVRKILETWNSRQGPRFDHYVPWMDMLPDGDVLIEHPALHAHYRPGALLTDHGQLRDIQDYLNGRREFIDEFTVNGLGVFRILTDDGTHLLEKQEHYEESHRILQSSDPFLASLFERLIHLVVPMDAGGDKLYLSSDLARGALFLSLPPGSAWTLALNLAHELGHQALMILNSADRLISDPRELVYSGVRKTERPALQSLHAAVALGYMILFSEGTKANQRQALEILPIHRRDLADTLSDISAKCELTPVGQEIFADLQALLT